MRTIDLTPEAVGVLRALARLGVMHRYDAVGLGLVHAGLAEVKGDRLVITPAGYAAAAAATPAPKRVPNHAGPGASDHKAPARPN